MFSMSLLEEIKMFTGSLHGDFGDFTLSNGRRALCFKGDGAAARAKEAFSELPENKIPISGIQEVTQGVYCFVL